MKTRLIQLALITGVVVTFSGGFLLYSNSLEGPGFPLDDAWIHQTYARNLYLYADWFYNPGERSGGSTAPLWSLALSAGYLPWIHPIAFTNILGIISLIFTAILGQAVFENISHVNMRVPWVGLFLAGEWHLVWASLSGMETILYCVIVLFVLYLCTRNDPPWFVIGLLIGIGIWVRPDACTLAGPALVILAIQQKAFKQKLISAGALTLGILFVVCAYTAFQYGVNGEFLPNTFYAKQAEYASLQSIPILDRWGKLAILPFIGAGVLLIPGLIMRLLTRKDRSYDKILFWPLFAWWAGFTAIYAWRLPVSYQHGRYLIPAMPVIWILGFWGFQKAIILLSLRASLVNSVLKKSWVLTLVLTWCVFGTIGAKAYAEDVAIIQSEMVASGKWISENTPADALIAVHDIGAVGYFGKRKIVDLAGLVTPEVIGIIRDEQALAEYMDRHAVDYLVTFPGWYADLPRGKEIIFNSEGRYSPKAGGENMKVYKWKN